MAESADDFLAGALQVRLWQVVAEEILADDRKELESLLAVVSDRGSADCILTSGGTGIAARDITPQATRAIADFEVPGIGEAMRSATE